MEIVHQKLSIKRHKLHPYVAPKKNQLIHIIYDEISLKCMVKSHMYVINVKHLLTVIIACQLGGAFGF